MLDQASLDRLFTEARTHYAWRPDPVTDDELRRLYELVRYDEYNQFDQSVFTYSKDTYSSTFE